MSEIKLSKIDMFDIGYLEVLEKRIVQGDVLNVVVVDKGGAIRCGLLEKTVQEIKPGHIEEDLVVNVINGRSNYSWERLYDREFKEVYLIGYDTEHP